MKKPFEILHRIELTQSFLTELHKSIDNQEKRIEKLHKKYIALDSESIKARLLEVDISFGQENLNPDKDLRERLNEQLETLKWVLGEV